MSDAPKIRAAVQHTGCHYLADEDSVCTKCGQYVKPYTTLERENADLRSKLESAQRDAQRWRYWRMFWPALCRMEVSRFARIDLTRKYVQSPADMDEVTDAAMQEVK